tara:strand:- start:1835 stop:2935 length:1101 start_codon:yes stop_codon:yes gene_type:complete
MSNQTLVLVHGMGSTTEEDFKEEFIDACHGAFQFYDRLKDDSKSEIEALADIKIFAYNHVFETSREIWRERTTDIREKLKALDGGSEAFIDDGTVSKIEAIYDTFAGDGMFGTHWLDVLLYRYTLLGEDTRCHFAKFLCDVLQDNSDGGSRVHVVAHSLGTSVVHDTLAKLYTPDFDFRNYTKPDSINTEHFKLAGLHMIANVSCILESIIDVRRSCVKPGQGGCAHEYLQYLNNLDPITLPKRFQPSRSGTWISSSLWEDRRYQSVNTSSLTSGNPHALAHYLANPENSYPLFQRIFPDKGLRDKDFLAAMKAYDNTTLEGRTESLEEHLENLSLQDSDSVMDLFEAMVELKNFLYSRGEDWGII